MKCPKCNEDGMGLCNGGHVGYFLQCKCGYEFDLHNKPEELWRAFQLVSEELEKAKMVIEEVEEANKIIEVEELVTLKTNKMKYDIKCHCISCERIKVARKTLKIIMEKK